jgi:hypothetical protein
MVEVVDDDDADEGGDEVMGLGWIVRVWGVEGFTPLLLSPLFVGVGVMFEISSTCGWI